MSRAERRAYKRMTKNQDPYAVPGGSSQRARVEQSRARKRSRAPEQGSGGGRFWWWTIGGAIVAGLLAFSVAWPNGIGLALLIGAAGAASWLGFVSAFRWLQRRMVGR